MSRIARAARSYPYLTATVAVIAAAGVLSAFLPAATPWTLGTFAGLIAVRSTIAMIRELRSGTFGVDILAVTAIASTIAVGETWASIVIVLMLTGGEALEEYAAGRARKDLTSLVSNAPHTAHRIGTDGTVQDVQVDEVSIGEQVLVRAHEIVPFDGVLVSEAGVFDDSSLTGESLPQERVAGDTVYSGAINGSVAVTIEVTQRAEDSQYQRIVALVADASASRAPMVRLADRYAIPFTAVALAIAGVAWWVSGDPVRFAEVLVVATPCPLIIGAPVAFMAGMSRSARRGVIIRSSATLEKLHRAATCAFDKTGTLTQGAPALTDIRPVGVDADTLLRLAAGAEQASAHILADAIVQGATARGVTLCAPQEVEETTAGGVTALVDGAHVAVGKRSFVAEQMGCDIPLPELAPGELAVQVGIGTAYAGCIILRDEMRPDAAATITRLRSRGISNILMLTGDEEATARHIAGQLDIDQVRAGCLPVDKVSAIRDVSQRPVIMVGDGVNDAPVLAAADVGIAMAARGSTAASESADVVILPDEINRVADALEIGRHTVNVALQSIWIGITVSVALMIVATTGVLPTVVGAWLQEVVDIIAIVWALRAMGPGGWSPRRRKPAVEPDSAAAAQVTETRPHASSAR